MHFTDTKKKLRFAEYAALASFFFLFIFFMNYTDYFVPGDGLMVPYNSTAWIGFSLIVVVGVCGVSYFSRLKHSTIHYLYLFVIFLLFAPLLFSDTTYLEYEYLTILAVFGAYTVFWITTQFSNSSFTRKLLLILLLSSLIQTFWGLLQYYVLNELSVFYLTADFLYPAGVFSQKNVYSSYLNLGSLLSLYFLFTSKRQSKSLLVFVCAVLVLNSHLNVLAETRTGRIFSLIAVAIYLSYFALKYKKFTLSSVLLIITLFFSFTPKSWFDIHSNQVASEAEIQSLGARPQIYQFGFDIALQNPIMGQGIGQVRKEYAQHVGNYRKTHSDYTINKQFPHIHNEPLQWFIQLGLISASSFIVLFGVWIWGMRTNKIDANLLLLALPFVGHSLLEFPFYTSIAHFFAFAVILGISVKAPIRKVRLNYALSIIMISAGITISAFTINLMSDSLQSARALLAFQNSGKTNLSLLEKMKPSKTFEVYYEIEKFEFKLKRGYRTGRIDQEEIFAFIKWAEFIKDYFPANKVYVRLAEAYIISQDKDSAKRVMDEALLLFPDDQQVIKMVNNMKRQINN